MDVSETEVRDAILLLVKEGLVCAIRKPGERHVAFIADEYATDEDREYTKGWLENPYFSIH
jgi:DNA-binding GntR family transcriptional regulator